MSFPPAVKEEALVACGRHCCLCHQFVGLKIELHHIIERAEGGKDTLDNCIPLCFNCHADMRSYDVAHPKGTKYTREELRRHRNLWYEKVKSAPSFASSTVSAEADRKVFLRFVTALPWEPTIRFIEEHDFGNVFRADTLNKLHDYYNSRTDPANEFLDPDLEGMRSQFLSSCWDFIELVITHTSPVENMPEMQKIPREWHAGGGLSRDLFYDVQKRINQSATKLVDQYRNFIRYCRIRFPE